ncbi:MAG TPA: hypothetical protein VIK26_06095 [Clostridium sp.]
MMDQSNEVTNPETKEVTTVITQVEKTFNTGFMNGRRLKQTMAISSEVEGQNPDDATIDKMVGYIVDLYSNQFTLDQFYDGIASDKVFSTFEECVKTIIGNTQEKAELLAVSQGKK